MNIKYVILSSTKKKEKLNLLKLNRTCNSIFCWNLQINFARQLLYIFSSSVSDEFIGPKLAALNVLPL